MVYKAKWHKSCHLKFAQSKLNHLKDKFSKKRKLEETECEKQRKSKRMSTGLQVNQLVYFARKIQESFVHV